MVEPIIFFNDNGEEEIECPDGYLLVETSDGPTCQKTFSSRKQRRGISVGRSTGSGLAGNRGRSGIKQKSKMVTSAKNVRPTIIT